MGKMVTRTVTMTHIHAMAGGDGRDELFPVKITVSGELDEKRAIKTARKSYDNDEHRVVYVKGVDVETALYGMTEEVFIANAQILPPRKANSEN